MRQLYRSGEIDPRFEFDPYQSSAPWPLPNMNLTPGSAEMDRSTNAATWARVIVLPSIAVE